MSLEQTPALANSSQYLHYQANLAIGFAILLALIILTAWLSLYQMNQNQQQLQHVLNKNVSKLEHIATMRHMARERTIAMQKVILLDDPFEQDEIYMLFNKYGAQFVRSRQSYLALGISKAEEHVLQLQGKLTGENIPVQNDINDLVANGQNEKAHQLLIEKSIPAQDRVLEQLDALYNMQKNAVEMAAKNQATNYQKARAWIIIIVLTIITVAGVVASVVFMRTRRFQNELFESREKALVTLKSIGEAVITTDSHGEVEYINPQAELLLDIDMTYAFQKPISRCFKLYNDDKLIDYHELLEASEKSGDSQFGIHGLNLHTRHNKYIVELSTAPIHDQNNNITGSVMAIRDVTAIRELDQELQYQACHDSLTGLLNRREFERRIQITLEHARIDLDEHAVCYIDLDMFKAVNDTCGHSAGDELLRQLATRLQAATRKTDVLARLGGDEFALLLQSCPLEKAGLIANNLLEVVGQFRFLWESHTFQIGASIGVAPIRSDSGTLANIIQTADFACYSAKDAGRNRVHIASDASTDQVEKRRDHAQWISLTRDALEKNNFELYFQDIKSLNNSDKNVRHVELLIRMKGEEGEIISPMAFIPAAERYHIMPQIDRWVIREAISLLSSTEDKHWRLSINLSGQSISDDKILGFIIDEINNAGINPEHICFEITETSAIGNLSQAIRVMKTLKGIGCVFSLDDFGNGLSSFAYLKNLPVNTVKIDGVFIKDLVNDETHRAIISSITQIAHVMNIKTVAEYVEDEETCNVLKDIGVDYGQGYFFNKPQSFKDELSKRSDSSE